MPDRTKFSLELRRTELLRGSNGINRLVGDPVVDTPTVGDDRGTGEKCVFPVVLSVNEDITVV